MPKTASNEQILEDLALIYISLAHSTDEELADSESDMIAERLQSWQAGAPDEALEEAVESALQAYIKDDAVERVGRAVRPVRDNMDPALPRHILDDMMDIALADGKFLYKESSFIGELGQAWDVHPKRQAAEAGRSWSILSDEELSEDSWTPIHDLAYIYLTLAHRTDDRLSGTEVEAITDKLGEWLPDSKWDDVLQVVKDALQVYVQDSDERLFADSVESVEVSVPETQREALLQDLYYVAHADGELIEREQAMIDRLSNSWDVRAETLSSTGTPPLK